MQKARVVEVYKKALESLYNHTVTVIESTTKYNPERYREESVEEIIYEDVPCRVSFGVKSTDKGENTTKSAAEVTLFVDPGVKIKNSSQIIANVDDNILEFKLSSPPAIYPTHREYILKSLEEPN